MTFPASVIRKLAPSEEMFAQSQTYFGGTVYLNGPVDIDAMFVAFDTLLQAHPVLAGHLERGPDGLHHIVVDDFLPAGIRVVEKGDRPPVQIRLDQAVSLAYLRIKATDGRSEVTLYTHHGLSDGQHHMGLVWELFSWYTDMVCTGDIEPVDPQPAPDSLEVVLEKRGVRKQSRSGFERLLPALYAYELPPSTRDTAGGNPAFPTLVPSARCQLTERETQDLITFTRDRKLSLNALIAAAMLLAEWQVRATPYIPVPYLYIADLRLHLTPPVDPTAATNPLGVATYLAEIKPNTDIVDLATDIVEAYRADLSEGVVQQSLLHYNLHYAGSPAGLPEPVMASHMGALPGLRTPPNVSVEGVQVNLYAANAAGVDFYFSLMVDGRLQIERHSHMPSPERTIEAIHALLAAVPSENDWITE
ncbi:phthiocerol/phthiodiolone dimycocerosyl transferase family protein [Mycobacterium sp.]|uniref:phthiocerol/phthiodiolone dimycocerosyl transferase family protein n=1 Tax=Mycobacterium sp. TaxID=1785 RepID=UPI003C73CAEB